MPKFYAWQKSTDIERADQMLQIGGNMGREPYKTLLHITPEETALWMACATQYAWLQNQSISDFDAFKQGLTGARDHLTSGPDANEFALPPLPAYDAPPIPTGLVLLNNWFKRANDQVKRWKLVEGFDEDLQRQFGLVIAPASADTRIEVPEVRSMLARSGGLIVLDVFKGHAAMAIVQLNVDGTGWPDPKVGGAHQKMLGGSHFEFQLEAGTAHSVQIREAFADRQGNMMGDWSAVKVMSSLA